MITIILGAPGTGKGTVSDKLVKDYNFKHISTGNIFKKIIRSGSTLGNELNELIAGGNLVDDETTGKVLVEGLQEYDLVNDKIILDGYPRNLNQVKFLEDYLSEKNLKLGKVINIELKEEMLIQRLTDRITCVICSHTYSKTNPEYAPKVPGVCDIEGGELKQRPDDAIENVKVRLNVFKEQTQPLVEYFESKNNIITFDGEVSSVLDIASKVEELNGGN